MTPEIVPFVTWLDPRTGSLEPEREVIERRLSDMLSLYLEPSESTDNAVIYRVHAIPVAETNSEIQCSTTMIEPGNVGEEYFMTKGHFHAVRERSEVYFGLSGDGLLLMADETGRHLVHPLRTGTVNYVPGGWAHRSVNVGDTPLVFLSAYIGDAGHDYATVEERGFPVVVIRGADGPEILPNPRWSGKP